jgi:hypothetical protein
LLLVFSSFVATAQTQPNVSYFRSCVNDIPNEPLVTVTITGASNVSCYSIEEDLPSPASAVSVSSGGVWLPSIGAIRWGPFFNTPSNSVSYRITSLAGTYPVNGGAWTDGAFYFSPGVTMIAVLPIGGGSPASPPPQVATPVFTPGSGSNVPVNVTISDATTNAAIYYTLDGSLPTTNSILYTNAFSLTNASTLRAVAFTNGFTPSVAALAYYGPPAATANVQVTMTVNTNSVTFTVTPGSNATCVALTESLPTGLAATNVTAGGNYIASNNVVEWGPFFGTNAQMLSYQPVGQPGTYTVQASWSVDGVGAQGAPTNLVIASSTNNTPLLSPPPQVAAPTFSPLSGANVPTNVTILCATPGAAIYFTLDGSLPTQGSTPYSTSIYLASASTVRAAAFTNGWTPSVASVAYYGPPAPPVNGQLTLSVNTNSPASPVVTLNVTPGAGASCIAVTALLPPGLAATSVTTGGNYIASNNTVVWGPFFGTNAQALTYQTIGQPGTYPVQVAWSVDGVGSNVAANIFLVSSNPIIPFPPSQEPTPTLSPSIGSNLPVNVSISSSDSQAQIYYTTNGTLPTQSSTPYTTSLEFSAPTTLRAVAFRAGYVPSVSALGYYVAALPANSLSLVRSISGNGTFSPSVTLTANALGTLSCYAVTETLVPGLTPSGLSADGFWNPTNKTISWGPYLDDQPRKFTYQLSGPSGIFPLLGQGSFDGYPSTAGGPSQVSINNGYIGEPTNYLTCVTGEFSYNVDVNPAPGVIIVDTASGTVAWGDAAVSNVTQPVMTLQHPYASPGTYTITLSVYWTGYTTNGQATSGNGTETDTVQVFSSCDPVITNQPTNQVVLLGTAAQFIVGASSEFPLSYQWYFNQTNPVVSPPTFATLDLLNVAATEAGSYTVVVANAYGSVTSSVAMLSVVSPLVTKVVRNANGSITLSFEGLANAETRLWASTNLSSPEFWQPIYTNTSTATNGAWQFTDTNAIDYKERFYRFSTP